MSEQLNRIVDDCERYWLETKVPRATVRDMKLELTAHLTDAFAAGKTIDATVGSDLPAFAEMWAGEQRPRLEDPHATWQEVFSGTRSRNRTFRWVTIGYMTAVMATLTILVAAGSGGSTMENELWRWVWVILAVGLMVGELFTAGFFLLPFGIGAAGAAVLAWAGMNSALQWIAFFALSGLSLWYVRRFMSHQDDDDPYPVGANRYNNSVALVIKTIDPRTGSGMVKVESEEWRASTNGGVIEEGSLVRVIRMTGTRLLVEETDDE